ncbi:MAG: 1-acyl-sn-glycerol-3-phosphate acyltransferase [Labilithrix sp.]|nr:1-acyl-sn-glycerol-3-phosphate acyltransferase [Labilithrix sp.]
MVRLAHRPTLEGLEHLPTSGPFLLVANHSGGLGIAEIHSFVALYAARLGSARPLAGFAHPLGFRVWPLSLVLRHIGAIPSTYDAAAAALAAGVPLLVFPGGDHEVTRPFWEANRVDFGGRRGFVRIAHRAWVPIVPMGIHGSHLTAPILLRSYLLPWLLVWPRVTGVKRWPITLLAVIGAALIFAFAPWALPVRLLLVWLWLTLPLTLLPWVPLTIRFRIGEPIRPDDLFASRDRVEDEELEAARATVEGAVQALVSRR